MLSYIFTHTLIDLILQLLVPAAHPALVHTRRSAFTTNQVTHDTVNASVYSANRVASYVTYNSVTELNAAIAALPASGGTLGVGVINTTSTPILINNKSGVKLVPGDSGGLVTNSGNATPNLEFHGTCANTTISSLTFTNTSVGSVSNTGELHSLIQTYYDCAITGLTIDRCYFKNPAINQNAITFTPYSPTNEGGLGQGNMIQNVAITNCVADSIGRAFFEITSHVHADRRTDIFYQNFTFEGNKCTNLGLRHTYFGPACSFSGLGQNITTRNNTIVNARFAGIELVSCTNAVAEDDQFDTTNPNASFSAYSISIAGTIRSRNITIRRSGGYVTVRNIAAYDVDNLMVEGGTWHSQQYAELRVNGGSYKGMTHYVTRGSAGGGAQCLHVQGTNNFSVTGNKFFETSMTEQNYSVLAIEADVTNSVFSQNYLYRPDVNQNDVFLKNMATAPSSNNAVYDNYQTNDYSLQTYTLAPGTTPNSSSSTSSLDLQYRQNSVSTNSGASLVLTHNFGANTAIDRIVGYENGSRVSVDIPFDVNSVTDTQVTLTPTATTTYTSVIVMGQKLP